QAQQYRHTLTAFRLSFTELAAHRIISPCFSWMLGTWNIACDAARIRATAPSMRLPLVARSGFTGRMLSLPSLRDRKYFMRFWIRQRSRAAYLESLEILRRWFGAS